MAQTDSAGIPWEGRQLQPHPFSGDSGEADSVLTEAITTLASQPLDATAHQAVFQALQGTRLYAPIMPIAVTRHIGAQGLMQENSSDMVMVRLRSADGRETVPGFLDIPSLVNWSDAARPVPVESERLCAATLEEGAEMLILNPSQKASYLVRRPALHAFLRGEEWQPAWNSVEVARGIADIAAGITWIDSVRVLPGSDAVHISGPEVMVRIFVRETPSDADLQQFTQVIQDNEVCRARVDSLRLSLVMTE